MVGFDVPLRKEIKDILTRQTIRGLHSERLAKSDET